MVLVTVMGASQMRQRKFTKMLVQNATFCCLLLAVVALLIKLKKMTKKHKLQQQREAVAGMAVVQANPI